MASRAEYRSCLLRLFAEFHRKFPSPCRLRMDCDEGDFRAAEEPDWQSRSAESAAYVHLCSFMLVPAFEEWSGAPGKPKRLDKRDSHLSAMSMACKSQVRAPGYVPKKEWRMKKCDRVRPVRNSGKRQIKSRYAGSRVIEAGEPHIGPYGRARIDEQVYAGRLVEG